MDKCTVETTAIANSLLKLIELKGKSADDLESVGAESSLKKELEYEKSKFIDKRFVLLFAGEIKTGKSSLINNLLGIDICTVDPGVCTNVNMVIRYGRKESITVHFHPEKDGKIPSPQIISRSEISNYVSEENNKNNKKNVRIIEVEEPLDILKDGVTFIDTPGLGSLNPYHAATTFSMAPIADVIIFVSAANREISSDEKEYVQRLISSSKCKAVLHVLTNADCGDSKTVLDQNDKYLKPLVESQQVLYMSCSVSNTLFEHVRGGRNIKISDTGFDVLYEKISVLQTASKRLLALRLLSVCQGIIDQYINDDVSLINAINDPLVAEKREIELLQIKSRIDQITDESDSWRIKLSTKIARYKNHVETIVKGHYNQILTAVEQKLMEGDYIKNPDKLGAIVSSEIVAKTTDVEGSLSNDLAQLYKELCDDSGLTLINEGLHPIDKPTNPISLSKPIVDQSTIYRNAIGSRLFLYGLAGPVIGGFIGGIIGTLIAPGPGTTAGMKIGAEIVGAIVTILGPIEGLLNGNKKVKQAQRDTIFKSVKSHIADVQSRYLISVKDAISDAEEGLRIAFNNALREDKNNCAQQLQEITKAKKGDESKRAALNKEILYLRGLEKNLATISISFDEK